MEKVVSRCAVRHNFSNIAVNKKFAKYFEDIDLNAIHFYIDMTNSKDILNVIRPEKTRLKFLFFIRELLNNTSNDTQYRHLLGSVYEMRFSGRPNARVICKEFKDTNPKSIVLCYGDSNKGTTDKGFMSTIKNIEQHYKYILYNDYQEYYEKEGKSK